jgi:hypothetical protein
VLTPFWGGTASFSNEARFGFFREPRACAGAWPLVQSRKSFFDEAAARALDGGSPGAQSSNDLGVGRAAVGME